jgi:hypothetical protein
MRLVHDKIKTHRCIKCMKKIRETLKPDGAFLAAMLGGESLRELR